VVIGALRSASDVASAAKVYDRVESSKSNPVAEVTMAPSDALRYELVEGWEQLPRGYEHRDVAGVAVDGEDRVFLICRGDHPVIAYDRKGEFLRSWGEGDFTYRTHGISIAPDGTVWCTDDGNHTVRQFTPQGKLLTTLGTLDTPADTGYDGKDYMTIARAAGPFNRPTNIAIGPTGDLYVSDGYGNARVHRFSPTGTLKRSWGAPGTGPGQFHIPHGIAVAADGRVFVCDRENDRIQIFDPDGQYLGEWTDTQRPTHLVFDSRGRAYVSELWWHPGQISRRHGKITEARHGRVSVFDRDGRLLARWGTPEGIKPGSFVAPHGLAVDSSGDVYVAEVSWTFAVSRGLAPEGAHTFQKFASKA
jgi:DNA-binding beta-propeller fold protein YncE